MAGPTADDQKDKTDTSTSAGGLERIRRNAERLFPALARIPVTATYAGLRAATEHRDYQIHFYPDQNYITVGGIRSTGLSGSLGIAPYVLAGLRDMGWKAERVRDYPKIKPHNLGEAFERPYQSQEYIRENPDYGRIVCHCERVSRAEIEDALNSDVPARDIDGLRRRTRASMGRCQGFHCQAALDAVLREANPSYAEDRVKKGGQDD